MRLPRWPSRRRTVFAVSSACVFIIGVLNADARAESPQYSKRVHNLVESADDATRVQNWDLAIQKYGDAQKELPRDPAILLDLGLANAKKGRPLASIIWFRAALVAGQHSDLIPKIEKSIRLQEIVAQSAMQEFLNEARKEGFPSNASELERIGILEWDLRRAGDIEGALELLKLRPDHKKYEAVARAALEEGDQVRAEAALELAKRTAAHIDDPGTKARSGRCEECNRRDK
jgi:hypothetical protein